MKRYQLIDHTADLGIAVFGRTKEELFVNAAYGMFEQITDLDKISQEEEKDIEINGSDQEDILVRFLSELLYFFNSQRFVPSDLELKQLDENHLRARVRGQRLQMQSHQRTEIKAVTYHGLKIQPEGDGWRAEVIFDV